MSEQTNSDGAAPAVAEPALTMAQLQAIVTLMRITGQLSDEQRQAWELVVSLMPWYAGVHYKTPASRVPLDMLWSLPAVPLAAAMHAKIATLAEHAPGADDEQRLRHVFAQGGADLLLIAEILGR